MSTASAIPRHSAPTVSRLDADKEIVEVHLSALMSSGRAATPFRRAMQYAVLGQGQRFRPSAGHADCPLCGQENALTLRAAAAVELIHCASLVVDDLPCMDDDAMRRDRPAAHVAFGEATALLAAFGLVALAARSVVEQPCPPARVPSLIRFQCELLAVLDASGLCEGQDLDLRLDEEDRDSSREHINDLKTVPLFVLAAQAGLMFIDPDSPQARSLRAFAREFGRAFQAVDDYLDDEITRPPNGAKPVGAGKILPGAFRS